MLPPGDISPHRSIPGSFWRNPRISDATARQAQPADISQLLLKTGSKMLTHQALEMLKRRTGLTKAQ
jgi:hypothetical protein